MSTITSRWLQPGVVETTVDGRVTTPDMDLIVRSFRDTAGGRSAIWVVRGEGITGYERGTVERAVTLFSQLVKDAMTARLVAVLPVPTVRMGATVVAMGMRAAGSPLDLIVVSSFREVAQHLPRP